MNAFGNLFKIQIFGESHGAAIGIIIDGCPAGIALQEDDFKFDIERRKPGAKGTTTRIESDRPQLISGVYNGYTTGAPIAIQFTNETQRSSDYEALKNIPRPGHADFVLQKKHHGFNDPRGGGHASGRLTLCLVAAGVIAKKIINPISIHAELIAAGGNTNIDEAIADAIKANDSIGGLIACSVQQVPVGLGEPFFDSLESQISHLIFAIPAVKGIAFGSGFAAAKMMGSQHNDAIIDKEGTTKTNHAGGINGGISNGNVIAFEVAIKPTSSTAQMQESINLESNALETFTVGGRHDVCIALRAPVVVEAATAIALADAYLRNKALT
jgi:chorismate synthase